MKAEMLNIAMAIKGKIMAGWQRADILEAHKITTVQYATLLRFYVQATNKPEKDYPLLMYRTRYTEEELKVDEMKCGSFMPCTFDELSESEKEYWLYLEEGRRDFG
jgi:hypothetical protein